MNYLINWVYKIGRCHFKVSRRHEKYAAFMHYMARGLYFALTGVFPEEYYKARRNFRATIADNVSVKKEATIVNDKSLLDLSDIRSYLDEEYWERGVKTGKSGYSGIYSVMGITGSVGWQFTQALDLKSKKLLDLGCASGQVVLAFRENGVEAYGIDLSDYAIAKGRKAFNLDDAIFQGSVHDLSMWSDGTFDFLYSNQVLEHLPEKYVPQLVRECFRVLKPGGRIWVGLVLSLMPDPEGIRMPDDPDDTHITLHYRSWWNKHFIAVGFGLDEKCMASVETTPVWLEYGWHQLAYMKPT
jgi:2-polyprenyl-3-methyl-5-hydroxy-6-metoxy-1,4-benzoquinol methylase